MRHFFLVALVGLLLLAACQSAPPPPTETPTEEPISEPTTAPTVPPTWTPTAEPSPTPAATSTPAATATPAPADVWVNAPNGLNLRAEAKSDAKLVTVLKHQQHLLALSPATAPDAGGVAWQNVRADDNQAGWASTQFLTTTNPTGAAPAPAATPAVAPPATTGGEAWVSATDGVNLRAQASTTSTLLALLPFGTHLSLTGAPVGPEGGGLSWQGVRTDDGKTGFVAAQYISTSKPTSTTPTPTRAATVTTTTVTITATIAATIAATTPATTTTGVGNVYVTSTDGLNLRAQPNTTSAVVATLKYGQRLTALAPKTAPDAGGNAWQNVRTEANQTGWAAANFLSTTPPVTSTATVTTTGGGTPTGGTPVTNATAELLRRINNLRIDNKLSPVALNTALTAAALRQSQDMAKTGNISHIGSDGSTPAQRIQAAGYPGVAGEEAVYGGRASVDDAWYFWTTDRLHANILLTPEYTTVGIAVVNVADKNYYTLVFGKP